MLTVRKNVVCF